MANLVELGIDVRVPLRRCYGGGALLTESELITQNVVNTVVFESTSGQLAAINTVLVAPTNAGTRVRVRPAHVARSLACVLMASIDVDRMLRVRSCRRCWWWTPMASTARAT